MTLLPFGHKSPVRFSASYNETFPLSADMMLNLARDSRGKIGFSSWFWLAFCSHSCGAGWVCGRDNDGGHPSKFHGCPRWLPQSQLRNTPVTSFLAASQGLQFADQPASLQVPQRSPWAVSQWISSTTSSRDFFLQTSGSWFPCGMSCLSVPLCDSQPVTHRPALTWDNPAKHYIIQGPASSPRRSGPSFEEPCLPSLYLPWVLFLSLRVFIRGLLFPLNK